MPKLPLNGVPRTLAQRLAAYGCTEFIRLDEKLSAPEQLEYFDLLPIRVNQAPKLAAVAEHQGTALLYLVDACGQTKSDPASLAALSRVLANRSDPAWLGVVQPGSLEIFPIGFHAAADTRPVKTIDERSATAPLFFQSLVHGTFEQNHLLRGTDYVYHKIFDLLMRTTNEFVPKEGKRRIDALEVLSMAGRALFFRFLIDRRIVLGSELNGPNGICPTASELKDAFSTAENAAQTSAWLDATFNGDFLPLIDESVPADDRGARETAYRRFYARIEHLVGKGIFTHLTAILRGWKAVGNAFQREIDWGDLDFEHIPVGVLSQVYESFSHRADARTARDTSVHYTPRTIAALMVQEAFAGVKDPTGAKVLDGSCGAGVFLVLAFRRLVRERWLRGNEQPNTAAIQEILYNQIRGFDISESALRLAALALYVTAIELNASPRPPLALKFPRNLRGEVLHRFGDDEADGEKSRSFPLGSLGPEVSPDFNRTFDIVIGNPPWTRLRDEKDEDHEATGEKTPKSATDELNKEFTAIGRRVLISRGLSDLATRYKNPDKNPDLPFLWRAMEWAKADGVIALAMPARLFGRTTGIGLEAWRAVLRSVQVTGLINGADLRKTAVWDGIDMPFCMFFARNAKPGPDHRFQYAVPTYDPDLNREGRFRIDYDSAQPLSVERVAKQPWLLKTLSIGTWLDVEVMEHLLNSSTSLADWWAQWDRAGDKTGQGYNRSPGSQQDPDTFLGNMLDFAPVAMQFEVGYSDLHTYRTNHNTDSAAWPRRRSLYNSPLVIIPQSPGDENDAPRAYVSERPLAFSQSFYGYSCAGHPEADTLSSLIYLLPHSTLFAYFCLMISRRSGFDRQTFNKEEFDALPFPDISKLPSAAKSKIRSLADRLQHHATKPWREIDAFLFGLYGLDEDAIQVANDTLFSATSYRRAGKAALDRTTLDTRSVFVNTLRDELEPYFDVCGAHVAVRESEFQPETWREPWFFLAVSRDLHAVQVNPSLMREAMEAANQNGCSRIIVHAPDKRGLLLGLLNQRRWWTITRARICAQHIIRECLGACGLKEDA